MNGSPPEIQSVRYEHSNLKNHPGWQHPGWFLLSHKGQGIKRLDQIGKGSDNLCKVFDRTIQGFNVDGIDLIQSLLEAVLAGFHKRIYVGDHAADIGLCQLIGDGFQIGQYRFGLHGEITDLSGQFLNPGENETNTHQKQKAEQSGQNGKDTLNSGKAHLFASFWERSWCCPFST